MATACAAILIAAPAAQAQEAPTASDSAPIEAIVVGYATGGDGGTVGAITASGVHTHWGTVAADWRLYPLGTRLHIEGFPDEIFVVEDTGGGLKGHIFDIWFPDLATAEAFGTRHASVTVIPPASTEKP